MLLVIIALVLAVVGYVAVSAGRQYQADRSFHPIKVPAPTATPADVAGVLSAATTTPKPDASTPAGPAPSKQGISNALAADLANGALGPSVAAEVYDAGTGATLLDQRSGELVAPASTAKLLVAAAILTVHKATDRFVTKVVAGSSPGTVVLVGGGDPTLSAAPAGQPAPCAGAARISDLAAGVKASMAGRPVSKVVVDSSVFSGPSTAVGWAAGDAPSNYASPITGTMADGGRSAPTCAPNDNRSGTPDLVAGQALATDLAAAGVSRGTAPPAAKVLAEVQSAPVGRLVEEMLTDSDNVIAEVLARQVAIAMKQPATFTTGAAAVSATLKQLSINVGNGMKDGSGLSGADRVPAGVLGQVLLKAVDPAHPELHPIIAGLSVAGWDGTLVEQNRFTGSASNADGVVRAKTGSLTGVTSLAGVVTDADGRMLVFAFVADKVPAGDPTLSRTALDQLAAALARCGCK